MVGIVPPIAKHYFGIEYDRVANVFATGNDAMGAKSMFVGPRAGFGVEVAWQHFTNFFGFSLVPLQISPFGDQNPASGTLLQVNTLPKLVIVGAFVMFVIACAATKSAPAI